MTYRADPFNDVRPLSASGVPVGGVCDGLIITANGNLGYTTFGGTVISAYAVTAGQIVPVRVIQLSSDTSATVLAGYH